MSIGKQLKIEFVIFIHGCGDIWWQIVNQLPEFLKTLQTCCQVMVHEASQINLGTLIGLIWFHRVACIGVCS